MTAESINYPKKWNKSTLRTIGQGFCGTVWASEKGPAYKREDGGPERSLQNDFKMHQRALQSLRKIPTIRIRIPACYAFIEAEDSKWWSENNQTFPPGFRTPCNLIQSQRIAPFSESVRILLISTYCPPKLAPEIMASEPNKDCLARLYLGRRRIQRSKYTSRFTAFSLRNFPLHLDQLETLGITRGDIEQYARVMADTLAMMHWVSEIDGNDIEFVLAPPSLDPCRKFQSRNLDRSMENGLKMESKVFGNHSLWVLDFDLCREITMDSNGVQQAAAAFWRNDPYYPRPGKEFKGDISLWNTFRENYLQKSMECINIGSREPEEAERRRSLSEQFICLVEQEGDARNE